MVLVRVNFRLSSKRWSREFTADDGTSVQQLKELMLRSRGAEIDLLCFELRRDRNRVSDSQLLWEDCSLDFKFLGPDRGTRRASRDVAESAVLKAVGANPKAMTLENVLSLQGDLMEGFGRPSFQKQLDELEEKYKDNERKFHAERQKLFLTVQKVVLPKWGFPGNPKGVFEMMSAMSQPHFNEAPEFQRKGWYLNKLLRLGPLGPPPPGPPAAPGNSSTARSGMLKLMGELIAHFESADFLHGQSVFLEHYGGDPINLATACAQLLVGVYADVLPRHGHEVTEKSIAGLWQSWTLMGKTDGEVRNACKRLEKYTAHDGTARSADLRAQQQADAVRNFTGVWSAASQPAVYCTAQIGQVLLVSCPGEPWHPARGLISEDHVIVLDTPEIIKGYQGKRFGDCIVWDGGEPWHRHVETEVTLRHGPNGEETTLQVPAGSTLAWVKGALGELDARLKGPDLQFAPWEGGDTPLQDSLIVTPLLNKLRVLPQEGGEGGKAAVEPENPGAQQPVAVEKESPDIDDKPADEKPGTRLPPVVEKQATDPNDKPTDEKPGTPRTGGEMFDFHDLPDD